VTHWLSYGAGVNSTAVLLALLDGTIKADPWRVVFADTRDEKDETYAYIDQYVTPLLRRRGRVLEVVCADEGVLERWERLSVTGNRILRTCSVEAKIKPITRHVAAHGKPGDVQLIGIHADEQHRAKQPSDGRVLRFPLIEMGWGHDECVAAITKAGLPVPVKSGCWHCPFARVKEVVQLTISSPCKFDRIIKLEDAANAKHGPQPDGSPRMQWRKPAREIRDGGSLFADAGNDLPCACWDGDAEVTAHERSGG
jgi:3'-phosphoadenosine 5'-phosphosulfate sulfotransferase (PAPS reductase)/FAD synthetase